jgi:SAM-dependent methyltransferase
MTTFGSPEASHTHSLQVLQILYEFDDFMQSISHVIDMGCGTGLDMLWWATRTTRETNPRALNIRCTGVDLAESCAATNRHKYVSYLPQDFEEPIRIHKQRFDVIWCHDAFQFAKDPFRTLRQWRDIVTPEGMLVITVPQTTNFHLNREQFEQSSGCFWHWTLVNLIHVLAVSGWNCGSGFFQKRPGESWITAIVYPGSFVASDPRKTNWYELCDSGMLPDSVVSSIQRHGYLRQQDLVLPWIDKSLTSFHKY